MPVEVRCPSTAQALLARPLAGVMPRDRPASQREPARHAGGGGLMMVAAGPLGPGGTRNCEIGLRLPCASNIDTSFPASLISVVATSVPAMDATAARSSLVNHVSVSKVTPT
ncbi:hypothetical protein BE20_14325 [Sorangium cellulosum]|nr:hypothetical protein BE20_14325 [Sorangium cellulosum]